MPPFPRTSIVALLCVALFTVELFAAGIPRIEQPLSPASAPVASGNVTVTIRGSGFNADAYVNGAISTTFIDSGHLTAIFSAGLPATSMVSVVNPGAGGGTSNAVPFQITYRTPSLTLSATSVAAGTGPQAVVAGNFNNDWWDNASAIFDLAIANTSSNSVSVLLGDYDTRGFQPKTDYLVGKSPTSIIAADFNHDGKPDLATANSGDGTISILLGNGDGTFQPATSVNVSSVRQIAAADLNADGNTDLIAVDATLAPMILLGNGSGSFTPATRYPAGASTLAVAVADLNGDSKLDLIFTNGTSNTVSVLLGHGDGTFAGPIAYPAGSAPWGIAVADLNGDGKLDLAVGNCSGGTVSILNGDGTGSFAAPTLVNTGICGRDVVVGDFDGDGLPDLALAGNPGEKLTVLLSKSDHSFRPALTFGAAAYSLAALDVEGNGSLDIATVDGSLGIVYAQPAPELAWDGSGGDLGMVRNGQLVYQDFLISNTGTAYFTITGAELTCVPGYNICGNIGIAANACGTLAPGQACAIKLSYQPTCSRSAEDAANLVAHSNIIRDFEITPLTSYIHGSCDWGGGGAFLYVPDFDFGETPVGTTMLVTQRLYNCDPIDINIWSLETTTGFAVVQPCFRIDRGWTPDGSCGSCDLQLSFTPQEIGSVTGTLTVQSDAWNPITTALLYGNGLPGNGSLPTAFLTPQPAAAVPGTAGLAVSIRAANLDPSATATWNGSPRNTSVTGNVGTISLTSADLAQDVTAHLAVRNPGTGGRGSNALLFHVTTPTPSILTKRLDLPSGTGPTSILATDLNGDGKPDLSIANATDNTLSVLLAKDGGFAPQRVYVTGATPQGIIAGDWNNDGKLDLVTSNTGDSTISVFLGNGDGNFQPGVIYPTGPGPAGITFGDFDRNANHELVVANSAGNTVSFLASKGDGSFLPPVNFQVGTAPSAVATGDFNDDGLLDLAVANRLGNSVSILLGKGDGTFHSHTDYATTRSPSEVVVADFNRDGRLDVAVAGPASISILLGKGDGAFNAAVDYASVPNARGLIAGDFNGDGLLDLAVVSHVDSGFVRIMRGDGTGAFKPGGTFTVGQLPLGLAVEDFDADGRLDLAVSNFGSNDVSVLRQAAKAVLSRTALDFGTQVQGTSSASKAVTLTNPGSAPLYISGIHASGDFTQTNDCSTNLRMAATCTLQVQFAPTAIGSRTGSIVLDTGNGPVAVSLTGNGIPPVPPTISLVTPVAGEKAFVGTPFTIRWTASAGAGLASVSVLFSPDGGRSGFSTIAGCTGMAGSARSCVWTPYGATGNAQIKVTVVDNVHASASVLSAPFHIVNGVPAVKITSVNNTDANWGIGTHQRIQWSHNLGSSSAMRVELSRDAGRSWLLLDPAVKNSAATFGGFDWTVTGPATNAARVRVTWTDGNAGDVNDANFTIAPVFISMASPASSADWGYGTARTVNWASNLGFGDAVTVRLSVDGGTTFPMLLGTEYAPTKALSFKVPALATASAAARVRVEWSGNADVAAVNPANFKIEAPFIKLLKPNLLSDVWVTGTTQTISWQSNLGSQEFVRLELSADGGASFPINLAVATPSDGLQPIPVQSGWISNRARVRVTWTKAQAIFDQSDQDFSIK